MAMRVSFCSFLFVSYWFSFSLDSNLASKSAHLRKISSLQSWDKGCMTWGIKIGTTVALMMRSSLWKTACVCSMTIKPVESTKIVRGSIVILMRLQTLAASLKTSNSFSLTSKWLHSHNFLNLSKGPFSLLRLVISTSVCFSYEILSD